MQLGEPNLFGKGLNQLVFQRCPEGDRVGAQLVKSIEDACDRAASSVQGAFMVPKDNGELPLALVIIVSVQLHTTKEIVSEANAKGAAGTGPFNRVALRNAREEVSAGERRVV